MFRRRAYRQYPGPGADDRGGKRIPALPLHPSPDTPDTAFHVQNAPRKSARGGTGLGARLPVRVRT